MKVKFLKNSDGFEVGEVVFLDDKKAKELLDKKIVVSMEESEESPKKKKFLK